MKYLLLCIVGFVYVTSTYGQALPPPGVSPCPYYSQYTCQDELDTDAVCSLIFNESFPSNGTVDKKCSNATLLSTAQQCAYTCAACCTTPAYNCQNAPAPNPFNCAVITKKQCQDPASQQELAKYCPATCGLCNTGSCTDKIDCSGMSGGCNNPDVLAFMQANCARTCGYCASSTFAPPGGIPGGNCVDQATNCATNKNLCTDPNYKTLMSQKCAATCGTCNGGGGAPAPGGSCTDSNANCASWSTNGFCSSTYYTQAQKQQYCARTCNLCSGK